MKAKRFDQLLDSQTTVARKVFNAVPTAEAWPSKRIYQELQATDGPVRNMRTVEGCLMSLVKSKLLLEKPPGYFKQVVPSDATSVDITPALESVPESAPKYIPDAAQIAAWSQPVEVPTVTEPEPVEAKVVPSEPSEPLPTYTPAPVAGPSVASDVPEGHFSQYQLPKHDIMVIYPNSAGVMGYEILLASQPGDVIRFARPEGVSLSTWRNRVGTNRRNYYKRHGLLIEAHFFNTFVDLMVMRQDTVQPPQNTLTLTERTPSAEEERVFPSRPMGSTTLVTAEDPQGVASTEVPVVEPSIEPIVEVPTEVRDPDDYMAGDEPLPVDTHTDDTPVAEPVPHAAVVVEDLRTDSPVEREFWTRVFFLLLEHSHDAAHAVQGADIALTAHRKQFL